MITLAWANLWQCLLWTLAGYLIWCYGWVREHKFLVGYDGGRELEYVHLYFTALFVSFCLYGAESLIK